MADMINGADIELYTSEPLSGLDLPSHAADQLCGCRMMIDEPTKPIAAKSRRKSWTLRAQPDDRAASTPGSPTRGLVGAHGTAIVIECDAGTTCARS